MAEVPKRIAAFMLALLFLLTAVGFSFLVILESRNQKDQDTNPANALSCQIGNGGPGATLPEPEVFKAAGGATTLQVTDLQAGNGPAAKAGDCIEVKYYGSLAATGAKFDGNFDQPTTLRFKLGQGQVIPGWDQGLAGLKVGGTRRLVIPPTLAYGDQSVGTIPANSTLVFVVKLERITKD